MGEKLDIQRGQPFAIDGEKCWKRGSYPQELLGKGYQVCERGSRCPVAGGAHPNFAGKGVAQISKGVGHVGRG